MGFYGHVNERAFLSFGKLQTNSAYRNPLFSVTRKIREQKKKCIGSNILLLIIKLVIEDLKSRGFLTWHYKILRKYLFLASGFYTMLSPSHRHRTANGNFLTEKSNNTECRSTHFWETLPFIQLAAITNKRYEIARF